MSMQLARVAHDAPLITKTRHNFPAVDPSSPFGGSYSDNRPPSGPTTSTSSNHFCRADVAVTHMNGDYTIPSTTDVRLGKRRADDSHLNDDERFAKRLNRLSLDLTTLPEAQHYNDESTRETYGLRSNHDGNKGESSNFYLGLPPTIRHLTDGDVSSSFDDHLSRSHIDHDDEQDMRVEDTPHRVYVSNLDDELRELAAVEAAEHDRQRLIFLPDIERYFSKLPQQILLNSLETSSRHDEPVEDGGASRDKSPHQELVLYKQPESWFPSHQNHVGHSHDHIDGENSRKAIVEARRAAKQMEAARHDDMNLRYDNVGMNGDDAAVGAIETAHGYDARGYTMADENGALKEGNVSSDPMDMD